MRQLALSSVLLNGGGQVQRSRRSRGEGMGKLIKGQWRERGKQGLTGDDRGCLWEWEQLMWGIERVGNGGEGGSRGALFTKEQGGS